MNISPIKRALLDLIDRCDDESIDFILYCSRLEPEKTRTRAALAELAALKAAGVKAPKPKKPSKVKLGGNVVAFGKAAVP